MFRIERFRSGDMDRFRLARGIRKVVFIQEQGVPEELEYEHDDEAVNYLLYEDDQVKGTARWRETEKGIKLERFAVLAVDRGKGAGTLLLKRVLEDVTPLGKEIYLHAQVSAMDFYLKAGFKVKGDGFEEAGIQHFLMIFRP